MKYKSQIGALGGFVAGLSIAFLIATGRIPETAPREWAPVAAGAPRGGFVVVVSPTGEAWIVREDGSVRPAESTAVETDAPFRPNLYDPRQGMYHPPALSITLSMGAAGDMDVILPPGTSLVDDQDRVLGNLTAIGGVAYWSGTIGQAEWDLANTSPSRLFLRYPDSSDASKTRSLPVVIKRLPDSTSILLPHLLTQINNLNGVGEARGDVVGRASNDEDHQKLMESVRKRLEEAGVK